MSTPITTGEETAFSLTSYLPFLEERNAALKVLACTSEEMLELLRSDTQADIGPILSRREQECLRYTEICREAGVDDDLLRSKAQNAARSGDKEKTSAAMLVLALYEDAHDLADKVMDSQAECESILRSRLQTTAKALKASTQRRKLDAAYGPAFRHAIPVPRFMDRQT